MKKLVLLLLSVLCLGGVEAQTQSRKIQDINIRDPFILPVESEGVYYMYASSSTRQGDKSYGGMVAWKSRDLENWEGPIRVFDVPHDNWITGGIWAPEVHKYKGKYYLFATMNTDILWKGGQNNGAKYTHRGTQIFWSKSPEGPFVAFDEKMPATPMEHMCLDGTLWVEDSRPYMIYCHEWVEQMDGEMKLVELKRDLSATVGEHKRLFCASAAPWGTGATHADGRKSYVTDGCFLYRTKTGKLLMIWSSFGKDGYAVGIAESTTGKVIGPWRQQAEPLYEKHGGHGMIFRDFEGRLCLVLHAPNSPGGKERAHIFELEDVGETLKLKGEITKY